MYSIYIIIYNIYMIIDLSRIITTMDDSQVLSLYIHVQTINCKRLSQVLYADRS